MYSLTVTLRDRPSHALWDLVSGLLYQFHSVGVEEEETPPPQGTAALAAANEFELALEPGALDPPKRFIAYFESARDAGKAWRAIQPHLEGLEPAPSMGEVEQKDYSEIWKKNFQPLRVPPRWLIRAPWHPSDARPGEIELVIEPGMAFGTGTHETTRACLELIAEAFAPERPTGGPAPNGVRREDPAVLDFGCGSGVLAIAMKKLGAASAFAIDIDPLAIEASGRNAALNAVQLTAAISVDAVKMPPLDVIAANILRNTLLESAPRFAQWLKPGGSLILSGLLEEQEPEILKAYLPLGFAQRKKLVRADTTPADLVLDDYSRFRWITLWLEKTRGTKRR